MVGGALHLDTNWLRTPKTPTPSAQLVYAAPCHASCQVTAVGVTPAITNAISTTAPAGITGGLRLDALGASDL